jgi:hypothetical protein
MANSLALAYWMVSTRSAVAANFAYGPDAVYRMYSSGPMDTSIWSIIKGYFDPAQYSFSLKRNGQDLVAASATTPSSS